MAFLTSAGVKLAGVAHFEAFLVAAVGAFTGDGEVLLAVEFEFVGGEAVIFFAFTAGQNFFGNRIGLVGW